MQFVTCKISLKILNICSYKSRIKNRKIHVKEIRCCRIWIISMIVDRSSYRYTHEITFHVPSHSISGCRTCLAFSDLATSGAAARSSGFLVYVYLLFEPVLINVLPVVPSECSAFISRSIDLHSCDGLLLQLLSA